MRSCYLLLLFSACPLLADGTLADYQRAGSLRKQYVNSAVNAAEAPKWIDADRFWYRRQVPGGHEFVLMNVSTGTKEPAFEHARMADALFKASGTSYPRSGLPLLRIFADRSTKELSFVFGPQSRSWVCTASGEKCEQPRQRTPPASRKSPDGKWEASIRNYNVYLQPAAKERQRLAPAFELPRAAPKEAGFFLSSDGSEGEYYDLNSISWSPDSTRLMAHRVRTGYRRKVNYVESSPSDQLQPKLTSIDYRKPGDTLDVEQPVLFEVASRRQIIIGNALFPNPFRITDMRWRKDSRSLTFEYNQRGHQTYRVIEINAVTGQTRTLIDEEARTFFCYSSKKFREDVAGGKEIIWMSERDGWNHLYLYDGATGKVKNQITKGEWVVRGVDWVDVSRREIWFSASGMNHETDPYLVDYYKIGFDGTGLTAVTRGGGDHVVSYSPDHKRYVDIVSRVDAAPVATLHQTMDLRKIADLETGDTAAARAAGWRPPEVFTAKGRDGKTDIWGVIYKPQTFDPSKKYPVLEYIYAGPQNSFVPKSFALFNQMQVMAEVGFIVVQIDGMGTSNRSKAFHDIAWQNIADAGFPDRILWHKAAAAKYPWYDVSRVGIYGTSAGGQNALAGLLFHPEFYKAGVAHCGCHDNRMDKLWWNEQWMGWPIGPQYVACSNADNAGRLRGKLLLTVGEMDTNVDPSSTMQVVNALIKANKTFDLLVIPGANHGSGGNYGMRKQMDFFVHHLMGIEPPDWNENIEQANLFQDIDLLADARSHEEAASEEPDQLR